MAKAIMSYDKVDALIEEYIYGEKTFGEPFMFEGTRYVNKDVELNKRVTPLKAYSKDCNLAWSLVSNFKLWYAFNRKDSAKNHMDWSFANDLSSGEIVTFVFIIDDGFHRRIVSAEGITLERAICLAVLKAKDVPCIEDDIIEEEAITQKGA